MKFLKKNQIDKHNLSMIIFLFINYIFSLKYFGRLIPYYFLFSLFLVIIYLLIFKYGVLLFGKLKYLNLINVLLISFFSFFSFFIFKIIPVEHLNVDRWSVIASFWDSYFKGEYVYFAKSNVGNPPGPMPFYFILALPFYLLGELGYFSIFGLILFYILLLKNSISVKLQTTVLLLVAGSVFFLWEVVCRSNIFLNGTLILLVVSFFLNDETFDTKRLVGMGIFIGLSISTRNVFIIPFIVTFVYAIKNKIMTIKQFLLMGNISLTVFVLTFLPFVWNHYEEFKIMNPFLIQSTFLVPFQFTILFIFFAFLFGFFCKNKMDVYFFSGVTLFLSIAIYFIYWIFLVGFQDTFFGSKADISYFILCVPFFIFHIISKKQSMIC